MPIAFAFRSAVQLIASACPRALRCLGLGAICLASLALTFVLSGQGYSQAQPGNTLGIGSRLYVRLEAEVCTKTSHLNQIVTAHVVRQATTDQGVLVPITAEVIGTIQRLIPSSSPSDHARMLIRFTRLTIPTHPSIDFTAHLVEVENARETVLQDGTIQGILEKDALVGRMDGMLDKLGAAGDDMEKVANKTAGKIDVSIDYPAGTDMVLSLDQPLTIDSTSPPAAAMQIPSALADAVQKMLAGAPNRAESKTKKPGDPLDLIIIGSSDLIGSAFKQAGWIPAKKLGARSAYGTVRALADDGSYDDAPVSQLYLFDRSEDLAFEKMLNTFRKRHHLRLWRTTVTTADGREIWLGATTHDIGIDESVRRHEISHAIDPDLDAERSKVAADLLVGGAVAAEQLVTRPNPLSTGLTATGGTWKTDGQMQVIELKTSTIARQ